MKDKETFQNGCSAVNLYYFQDYGVVDHIHIPTDISVIDIIFYGLYNAVVIETIQYTVFVCGVKQMMMPLPKYLFELAVME